MMDPVIKGLSLESPCKPSLGNALLISPERYTNIIILLKKELNQSLVDALESLKQLPSNGAPSLPECALFMGPSIMS